MSGGRMNSFLNSIPGYGGYRSKEQRRESDRLIRERLANDYGHQADRLGRLATRFADERDIASVRAINKPHTRLVTFRDRVRTATYGYAPLFSQNSIDERALEQIAAFDESLGEGLEPLSSTIGRLESTPPGTEEFAASVGELERVIEDLHERFARRGEIFEKGAAIEPERVASLLGPTPGQAEIDRRPTAYNLHDGEAITFGGQNFTVVGRVTVDLETGSRRYFQLNGGAGSSWFGVPESAAGEFQWLERVHPDGSAGAEQIRVGDVTFEKVTETRGKSEVIGSQGATSDASVTYYAYRGFSGTETIHVYDWGVDSLALRGARVDPIEVQIWSREGRDAV
jgi:hypothetical protein